MELARHAGLAKGCRDRVDGNVGELAAIVDVSSTEQVEVVREGETIERLIAVCDENRRRQADPPLSP